jgi:Ca2+-binding EF-hand superfamily protein
MSLSIGSISSQLGAIQERWQALHSSKGTLSKSDLETVKNNAEQFLSNFGTIDTNGDGISADELQIYAKANGMSLPAGNTLFGGLGGFPGGGFGGRGPMGGEPPSMSKDELTAMKDKMTAHAQEASEGLGKLIDAFAQVDTDGDGKASASEIKTFADANGITLPHGPAFPRMREMTESSPQSQDATTNSESGNASSSSVSGLATLMMQKIMNSYLAFGADAQQGLGSLLNNVTV